MSPHTVTNRETDADQSYPLVLFRGLPLNRTVVTQCRPELSSVVLVSIAIPLAPDFALRRISDEIGTGCRKIQLPESLCGFP